MYEASFSPISNRADWTGTIELVNDDTNDVIEDLTGVTVQLEIRQRDGRCRVLSATTEDGHITLIAGGVIQWHFTASEMHTLSAGTYEIGIIVERDDITTQQLIGTLPIVDGIVRS